MSTPSVRNLTLGVVNPAGEAIRICVRSVPAGYRVFIDGGLLSCGDDDATLRDFDSALAFALAEASCIESGDEF